jgi:hypothetical protein
MYLHLLLYIFLFMFLFFFRNSLFLKLSFSLSFPLYSILTRHDFPKSFQLGCCRWWLFFYFYHCTNDFSFLWWRHAILPFHLYLSYHSGKIVKQADSCMLWSTEKQTHISLLPSRYSLRSRLSWQCNSSEPFSLSLFLVLPHSFLPHPFLLNILHTYTAFLNIFRPFFV